MENENKFQLNYAVHPGEYLEEMLEASRMSQKELADRTNISTKHINLIISGKANMTAKTAVALENALNRPAKYWLDLQASFDEYYERQKLIEELQENSEWIRLFDYREMAERKYVEATKYLIQKGINLLSFFQVSSVEAWHATWKTNAEGIYCRSGARTGDDVADKTIARLAQWIRIGQLDAQAKAVEYPRFNPSILDKDIRKIRDLNVIDDPKKLISELTDALKPSGVLIQFVKEVSGMRTYGTSFMVRNNEVACIQLCLRGRTNDQLWFSLLHEICHLLGRGNNKGFLIGHSRNEAEEQQADEYAKKILIPDSKFQALIARKDYSVRTIVEFSKENNVHAGIVIGRLQHDKLIGFNSLNHLKAKYEWAG